VIVVILRTTNFCGDHSRDVSIAHELQPGETVEALVARLLPSGGAYGAEYADHIEIRVAQPAAASRLGAL
jgi:hypothetical protein